MMHILKRIEYFWKADRLGPDMLLTHILSYFPKYYKSICKKKFRRFGENSELRPGAFAITCSGICIGNHVKIHPGSMFFGDRDYPIIIRDHVMIGPNVFIYSANHRFSDKTKLISEQGDVIDKSIVINEGAWIGGNVTILSGVVIGEHAVVGAGSVVDKDVPEYTLFAGVPAKLIKKI